MSAADDRSGDDREALSDDLVAIMGELRAGVPLTPDRRAAMIERFIAGLAADEPAATDPAGSLGGAVSAEVATMAGGAPSSAALSASPSTGAPLPSWASADAPAGSVTKARPALASTDLAIELPPEQRAPVLPFVRPENAPKKAAQTMQSLVMPAKGHGQTVPLGDGDNRMSRLVQAHLAAAQAKPAEANAEAPQAPPVEAAAPELDPAMPLLEAARYGCLRAELELSPAQANEIWSSYGAPALQTRQAVVRYWDRRMAADPSVKGMVEGAKTYWSARLRARRGG